MSAPATQEAAIRRESLALGLSTNGSPRQVMNRLLSYKREHQLRAAAKVRALSLKRKQQLKAARKSSVKARAIDQKQQKQNQKRKEFTTRSVLGTDKARPAKHDMPQTRSGPARRQRHGQGSKKTSRVKTTKKTGRKGVLQKLSMTPLPSATASLVSRQRQEHRRLRTLLMDHMVKSRTPV